MPKQREQAACHRVSDRYDGAVKKRLIWPMLFIVVLALSRWPKLMPQNFSAAYAIVFCAGLYLPGLLGWIVPLHGIGDQRFIDQPVFLFARGFSLKLFLTGLAPNYLAYAGIIGLGRALGPKRPVWMLIRGGLLRSAVCFILILTCSGLADAAI